MDALTRDWTAEPYSRDQILRRERGQGKFRFPFLADHKQDWQPYPVDAQSAESDDHNYPHSIMREICERARFDSILFFVNNITLTFIILDQTEFGSIYGTT